ncbi:MAG: hypothetical protein HRT89_23660 [Lentisphaeria bacterium]|nr:hypothetical protein [Lentisphaeria bacterium]
MGACDSGGGRPRRKEAARLRGDNDRVLFWDSASDGRYFGDTYPDKELQIVESHDHGNWPHRAGGHMMRIDGAAKWVANRLSDHPSGVLDGTAKTEHWPAAEYDRNSYNFESVRRDNTWSSTQGGFAPGEWMNNAYRDYDMYYKE